ncbi:sugar ABC transporter permease [Paenibacillus rhizovicinus]|uniref:Sugar ABC transporter permease n=1 Tax=Paenibacillus rhizovicinus TaxID=2704463 RepID=A0A6C0PCJ8_9BACL|nr:ABC transporter permease subunit [Paenibacillus rhizovicinus]QHW34722.1 sugar ABC transporter permease [Paenibacillus rhizovicinus]
MITKLFKNDQFHYHVMLIPVFIVFILFNVLPIYGVVLAFKHFVPTKGVLGSPWAGLEHYHFLVQNPEIWRVLRNTLLISVGKLVTLLVLPIILALMLNELRTKWFKRTVQTITYLPHFLSWVILAGIFRDIFSTHGIINYMMESIFHIKPIMYLGSNIWFRPIIILSNMWKEMGFSTIIYLAALTSISPTLYEAAEIDGAGRIQKIWHVSIPGIAVIIALLATLSLNGILYAGFDQIYNLYNVIVYDTADVIETWVFRNGLVGAQYEIGTAVSLVNSLMGLILIALTYTLAYRFANYRIF